MIVGRTDIANGHDQAAMLYGDTVMQAEEDVGLDLLVGKSGAKAGRPSQ